MQKIHIQAVFDNDIKTVFNAISDHANFLTGGGLRCVLVKTGEKNLNGNGAIRQVISKGLTFEEEIFDFQPNKHFAYVILSTTPKLSLRHDKGWLDFQQIDGKTQVDWHSHFEITIPIIGGLIGWFAKRQMSQVFAKRLSFIQTNLR